MSRWELYERWAPEGARWSDWVKPVLFAGEPVESAHSDLPELLPILESPGIEHAAIVVDLPGAEAVKMGLRLARVGVRPVPLFNSAPGFLPSALVDTTPLTTWLRAGGSLLASLELPWDAPPAFLVDSRRQGEGASPSPGRFDNRWLVFPQDFPSARFLNSAGLERVCLVFDRSKRQVAEDLGHVLCRWQEGGLGLFRLDPLDMRSPIPIQVPRPRRFRALWYLALAMVGLRRNSTGGFGAIVPEPSSGG